MKFQVQTYHSGKEAEELSIKDACSDGWYDMNIYDTQAEARKVVKVLEEQGFTCRIKNVPSNP